MKTKFIQILTLSFLVMFQWVIAQNQVAGLVTDGDGVPLPGATVVVKGTSSATTTDFDGKFSIVVEMGQVLSISYVGYQTQEISVESSSDLSVVLTSDNELDEVVVTALGISREKKSLGYSVQEVSGDAVDQSKESSFISALSGRVSGLDIRKSNSLGGSVNAVIRGNNSFTGNNQALFVVDGIPISNSNLNSSNAINGRGGYDYGNAASDINPNDIESVSVLKGASASALYGSSAANGVILITTKKGSKRKGLGVTVSNTTTLSSFDKDTFPEYQSEYGAGYGAYYGSTGYFYDRDINGDGTLDYLIPVGEDASFGGALDGTMIYDWTSLFPSLDTYLQPRPYLPAENGPEYILQDAVSNTTSVNLEGGNDEGTFRLGYTNEDREGILPNSKIRKDLVDLTATYQLTDRFKADAKLTFTRVSGKGRYGTGYDAGNSMQALRQWFQVNVDLKEQEDAYFQTRQNITWNPNSETDTTPHYFDNFYFRFYENYSSDQRSRTFAAATLTYDLNDWLVATARFGADTTSDLQEERINKGAVDLSKYSKYVRGFEQFDYSFFLSMNQDINEDISVSAVLGGNVKTTKVNSTYAITNGGLVVPGVWSLSNSSSALSPPSEYDAETRKVGYFAQATVDYKDILYIDGTFRVDKSSTLPTDNNTYNYPSLSSSFLFGNLIDAPWLSFGKIRVGYAEVANDAGTYQIMNTASAGDPYGSTPMYYISDTSKNPNLRPESTTETEFGIETKFFNNKLGLDVSIYKKNTIDQIIPVQVSTATGFNTKFVNAGEMENKGVEITAYATPVNVGDFTWNINANWAKNKNMVLSLFEDGENILLNSQWSSAVNARVGQPFGTITGTDFVYDEASGKKVVGSNGKYLVTSSTTEILGNIQPDWKAGIFNNITYKNFNLGFLIDIQKGGDVISWDNAFGLATGIYAETAGLNDKGNPKRDPVSAGGGILLPDTVYADGTPNTTYASAGSYTTPIGYYGSRNIAQFLYDASYVKLRELSLSYKFPSEIAEKLSLQDLSVGLVGRNLWIIDKNLPYSDPEASQSAGNYANAIQIGALPATKDISLNVTLKF